MHVHARHPPPPRARLQLLVQPVAHDEVVAHAHAVRLHGVAHAVVVVAHVAVVVIGDLGGGAGVEKGGGRARRAARAGARAQHTARARASRARSPARAAAPSGRAGIWPRARRAARGRSGAAWRRTLALDLHGAGVPAAPAAHAHSNGEGATAGYSASALPHAKRDPAAAGPPDHTARSAVPADSSRFGGFVGVYGSLAARKTCHGRCRWGRAGARGRRGGGGACAGAAARARARLRKPSLAAGAGLAALHAGAPPAPRSIQLATQAARPTDGPYPRHATPNSSQASRAVCSGTSTLSARTLTTGAFTTTKSLHSPARAAARWRASCAAASRNAPRTSGQGLRARGGRLFRLRFGFCRAAAWALGRRQARAPRPANAAGSHTPPRRAAHRGRAAPSAPARHAGDGALLQHARCRQPLPQLAQLSKPAGAVQQPAAPRRRRCRHCSPHPRRRCCRCPPRCPPRCRCRCRRRGSQRQTPHGSRPSSSSRPPPAPRRKVATHCSRRSAPRSNVCTCCSGPARRCSRRRFRASRRRCRHRCWRARPARARRPRGGAAALARALPPLCHCTRGRPASALRRGGRCPRGAAQEASAQRGGGACREAGERATRARARARSTGRRRGRARPPSGPAGLEPARAHGARRRRRALEPDGGVERRPPSPASAGGAHARGGRPERDELAPGWARARPGHAPAGVGEARRRHGAADVDGRKLLQAAVSYTFT